MEIQRADATARRKALTIVLVSAVVALPLVFVADSYRDTLMEWMDDDPLPRARLVLTVGAVMTCVPALGLGLFLGRLGFRVRQTRRFPPPGMAVTRDTPVRTDAAALTVARIYLVGAAVCVGTAILGAFTFWRIAQMTGGPGG